MAEAPGSPGGPIDLVVFGASGDLAHEKILPALGPLEGAANGLRVVGAGRSAEPEGGFRELVRRATGSDRLAAEATWVRLDYGDPRTYAALAAQVESSRCAIFYLATPPVAFEPILGSLAGAGLARRGDPARRVVVEKPLGHDAASARRINACLAAHFEESQVFRIDHYLAKDTVQNVLALRFSNSLFEPMWNRTLVHSIQITAAESKGIGGRAGYYDGVGAVRDMIQNHVLQVLALVIMDAPTTFDPASIRKAKLEALRAVQPLDPAAAVRGQYEGYLAEDGVAPGSRRETFAAARLVVENWRWEGVPIFVRTGKRLRRSVTEVVIRLRDAPHLRIGGRRQPGIPTLIVVQVQPEEGVLIRIGAKRPGTQFEMLPAGLRLGYADLSGEPLPDAYENVLREVLEGGHSMFPGGREIERSWEIVDPLVEAWEAGGHPDRYPAGSWGPAAAEDLVAGARDGRWVATGEEPGTR